MPSPLILALQDAGVYDHPVEGFSIYETHISQIILTGPYAYKIKKPLDLGFLDFSTLARRKHFCEEEVRLNRRLAPELYLEVVALTGSPEAPVINGPGEPFEYAVKMRQFDQGQLFDKLDESGRLSTALIDELAGVLARFHQSIPAADPANPLGTAESTYAPILQNFDQIRAELDIPELLAQLDALQGWVESTYNRLKPLLTQRHQKGAVRECHGDLHLGNIALFEGRVTIFDCIEFNESFRWIDTTNDLAFLLMDLDFRGSRPFSSRLMNAYLELTGDFDALPLITFYKTYRALVRAKIALLRRGNEGLSQEQRAEQLRKYRDYAQLAEDYTGLPNRFLLAMHGVSGSGKSRVSRQLSQSLGMVRFRSDVERKRLFGLTADQKSDAGPKDGIYSEEASRKTYVRLAGLAASALLAGFPVVVDAAGLKREQRRQLAQVAEDQGVPFLLVHCDADPEVLRTRVAKRAAAGEDASEADLTILAHQLEWLEPLDDSERSHTIHVDTGQGEPAEALTERLRQHLKHPGAPG